MTVGLRAKTSATIAARRRKVAQLYLRHVDQEDIGRQVGVDQATVSRDVTALKEAWREEAAETISERIHQELVELDEMEHEAVLEFARTRLPRWVDVRLDVKKYRAALLGWLKPNTTLLAANTQAFTFTINPANEDMGKLSDTDLDRRIDVALQVFDRARERQERGELPPGSAAVMAEVYGPHDPRTTLASKLDGLRERRESRPRSFLA